MKTFFLLLFLSTALFAFENGTKYKCQAIKRDNIELSPSQQLKTAFDLYIKKDGTYLKTSRPLIYDLTKSKLDSKDRLYIARVKVKGKQFYFKLQFTGKNTLLRFVTVPGYGNLISEYVTCTKKYATKKDKK